MGNQVEPPNLCPLGGFLLAIDSWCPSDGTTVLEPFIVNVHAWTELSHFQPKQVIGHLHAFHVYLERCFVGQFFVNLIVVHFLGYDKILLLENSVIRTWNIS